ncbi:MAG: WecB/TagA/CpsF family glycosyltransferase [Planctomycetota bacterium]|nr:MAG: WecB/TagA/CpsF family glycosyltransferase [Planctomycetota bacterium]
MTDHLGRVNAAAMIGVGAAFDFHSGNVKWAPEWI